MADALIVSGVATGAGTSLEDLRTVKGAVPEAPLLVGGGASAETAPALLGLSDGLIVASSLKADGLLANPVDLARVAELSKAMG